MLNFSPCPVPLVGVEKEGEASGGWGSLFCFSIQTVNLLKQNQTNEATVSASPNETLSDCH